MTKQELDTATDAALAEGKLALVTVLAALNPGQRKKVCAVPAVAALVERYGVEVDA